jgi:hypothetical protein
VRKQNEDDDLGFDLSRSEVNAQRILRRIHVHDFDSGGIYSEITGSQGSGKTSILLSFVDYTITHYPEEKIFWSECYNAPLQFPKIGKGRFNIMIEDNTKVTFHDRAKKLKQVHVPVTTFKNYNELYDLAKPRMLNAVFLKKRTDWMDFIKWLKSNADGWSHIYIDEMSEVCPAYAHGHLWKKIGDFSFTLKDIRKSLIYLHTNTQSVSDVDHRCRSKIMLKIFLPGSRTDKNSRLTQRALDNLFEDPVKGNESYLEYSGKFGKCQFSDIYKPIPGMHWEARLYGS